MQVQEFLQYSVNVAGKGRSCKSECTLTNEICLKWRRSSTHVINGQQKSPKKRAKPTAQVAIELISMLEMEPTMFLCGLLQNECALIFSRSQLLEPLTLEIYWRMALNLIQMLSTLCVEIVRRKEVKAGPKVLRSRVATLPVFPEVYGSLDLHHNERACQRFSAQSFPVRIRQQKKIFGFSLFLTQAPKPRRAGIRRLAQRNSPFFLRQAPKNRNFSFYTILVHFFLNRKLHLRLPPTLISTDYRYADTTFFFYPRPRFTALLKECNRSQIE